MKDRFVHREGKCTFCNIFNFWPLLVWQCTSRSTNPQSRFVIISYFCFSYTFFAIHIFLKIFSKMHLLHVAVYLILAGIRVCDSSEPTMHSVMIIESEIHPCADSINYAYLAFQVYCQRVTHSFRNVSPWTSLLLALLNIRSIRNKSASFLEVIKDNNADLIAVTETWLRPEDTEGFISSITPPGYKFTHVP